MQAFGTSLSGIMHYGCFSYFSSLRNVDYFRFLYVGDGLRGRSGNHHPEAKSSSVLLFHYFILFYAFYFFNDQLVKNGFSPHIFRWLYFK